MKLYSAELRRIKIKDAFWIKHVKLVKDTIIPYQWKAINDQIEGATTSHSLENYRIAAGKSKACFKGQVFQDTDVAKWLEAVGFVLAYNKDSKLEETADGVIDLIEKAQCEDGYLNTYFTLVAPEKRWKNLCEGHELYTAGHLMEAACAYYLGTGKDKFLKVMQKNADLICETFGEEKGKLHGYPGHQEVEIGLIKLYEITGKEKYLKMAKYFIDNRGVGENYFLKEMSQPDFELIFPEFRDYDPIYSQSHVPVRKQWTAEGHAVRAAYMYTAMADLAYFFNDAELMEHCKKIWDNIVEKRMYITGSIGSSGILERFTTDYDLPNDYNYSESCASIGFMMFAKRMANQTRDAKYMDTLERTLYNTVLAGIALDGQSFFYVNPLEVWPAACMPHTSKEHIKATRQKWFGVACCPTNIARTLASLGQYIYGIGEDAIYLNLFISNETEIEMKGQRVKVKVETKFPWENTLQIQCENVPAEGMKLAARIPEYAEHYRMKKAEAPLAYENEKGYAVVELLEDTTVTISFESKPRFIRSNPLLRADCGKLAIAKGPLIYCFEGVDNGSNLSSIFISSKQPIIEEWQDTPCSFVGLNLKGRRLKEACWSGEKLYSTEKIEFEEVQLRAIPYAYWGNRGENEMSVWMKEWFE